MSFGFRTMLEIEGDVQHRFSAAGMTLRHPGTRIRQLYNVSWGELREKVSLLNDGAFLEASDPAPLPTAAAVTGEAYAEVDLPVDVVAAYGVRVLLPGSTRYRPLKRIGFAAIHDFQCRTNRGPRVYHSRKVATGAPAAPGPAEVVGKVMIAPVPTGGVYRLWYLKAWAPQVQDADKFGGHASWVEWALWHTCIKMMGADQKKTRFYEIADRERGKLEAQIEARAQALDSGMSEEPRDARGDGEDDDYFWGEEW